MKTDQLNLLATVVLAFLALATLVLAGQAGIRDDVRALRAAMLIGHAEFRAVMRTGQAELRAVIQAGPAELRQEMGTGQVELHEELRAIQAELRAELRAIQAGLRTRQAERREELSALGTRLAVVEHRTDRLEIRPAATESPASEPCEGADCPGS